MKYEKIIEGNLEIKKGDNNDYSKVEKITGNLIIYSNAKLEALQSIGGYCYINSNAKLEANNLQSIGGDCYIHSNAKLEALQSIGGYCYIHSNAKLEALQSIGGYCYIDSNAKLEANNLQSIGGDCRIDSNAKLEANEDLKVKDKYAAKNTKKLALEFNFNCFLRMGFLFADRILAKIIEHKKNVYKIQIVGKTKISYCIEITDSEGNRIFSHGDTIKQAKESLIYKISNRDTSMYKDYTLETKISFNDAIKMYRIITGACEAGTRNFVESLGSDFNKRKKYTVKEVIEKTKGRYGNDKLKEFFKK